MCSFSSLYANETAEGYRELLGQEEYQKHITRAEDYRNLFLGNCFQSVVGKPAADSLRDIDQWQDLERFNAIDGLELYNPKVSPDGLSIFDVASGGNSCWTQLASPYPPLSITPLLDTLMSLPGMSIAIIDQESGPGLNARTILYSADGFEPVILHLRVHWGDINNVVAVARRHSGDNDE